jgi:hypothetical protein
MPELLDVEIRVQLTVDPLQQIEIKSPGDPRLVVVRGEYSIGTFL